MNPPPASNAVNAKTSGFWVSVTGTAATFESAKIESSKTRCALYRGEKRILFTGLSGSAIEIVMIRITISLLALKDLLMISNNLDSNCSSTSSKTPPADVRIETIEMFVQTLFTSNSCNPPDVLVPFS